jgi:hypothetical protein
MCHAFASLLSVICRRSVVRWQAWGLLGAVLKIREAHPVSCKGMGTRGAGWRADGGEGGTRTLDLGIMSAAL